MPGFFKKLRAFVAYRKTYITAISGWLTALAGWGTGALTGEQFVMASFAALTAIWLRAGVAKSGIGSRRPK